MKSLARLVAVGLLVGALCAPAQAASLLPNGEQTFLDANGQPLAAGKVYFYVPNTLTPKATWSNSGETVTNANPVPLDSAGRAIIYGAGAYRQIVKDVFGNTIWDQLTQGFGSGGVIVNPVITGSTTIAACSGIFPVNNVSGAPITLTMPTSPADGDSCEILDAGANSSVNSITMDFGVNELSNGRSTFAMNFNASEIGFIYSSGIGRWLPN